MKQMKKMLEKNDEKEMSMKKDAKLSALHGLKKMATDLMGEDLKSNLEGMKKVTVASPDKEGLKLGLEKAKDMVSNQDETEESEMDENESVEDEVSEIENPEDIDKMIKLLQEKKAKMMSK